MIVALAVVYGIILVAALAFAAYRYRERLFIFEKSVPGIIQVGLEVGLLSFLVRTIWSFRLDPAWDSMLWGIKALVWISAVLLAVAAAAWPGIRNAEQNTRYVLVQAVIAYLFFLIPWFVYAVIDEYIFPPAPSPFLVLVERVSPMLMAAAMAGFGWPIYTAVAAFAAPAFRHRKPIVRFIAGNADDWRW